MKIATWNLNYAAPGHAVGDALRAAMAAQNADVWVLTETRLGFSPGDDYALVAHSAAAPDLPQGVAFARFVAIWSRLPARLLAVSSEPERMACARLEQAGQRDVVLVGTVLPWRSDRRRDPLRGADAFCASLQAQAAEWAALWGSPRACAFCVAGDFNQECDPPHCTGSEQGQLCLHDVLARLELDCLTCVPGGWEAPYPNIDHICVGGRVQALGTPPSHIWPIPVVNPPHPATNHYGVCADLDVLP